jgi:cytochrome c5
MTIRFLLVMVFALASLSAMAALVPEGQPPVPPVTLPAVKPESSRPPPVVVGSRGRMLYENHCTRCHTSVVHVREKRRADSLRVLEAWVRRWSGEEKLPWSEEEIIEVVDYLNLRYYKFSPKGGR